MKIDISRRYFNAIINYDLHWPCVFTADNDEDGFGNICDNNDDKDRDGINDLTDNCVNDPNANQLDTDEDGLGDECDPDIDNDNIPNAQDNCPLIPNPDQKDTDRDGRGNVCQDDFDGDMTVDILQRLKYFKDIFEFIIKSSIRMEMVKLF